MGRWEPGANSRLRRAAMELFTERGYELTTVADIAERAGVTSRTFFRHFTDKREVLFLGSAALQDMLVTALVGAPPQASPMECVTAALEAAAEILSDRTYSARRQTVIIANAELRERELIKMASLAEALAEGLRGRGVPASDASLAAEAGVVIFRLGFDQWVSASETRGLAVIMHDSMNQLKALTATVH